MLLAGCSVSTNDVDRANYAVTAAWQTEFDDALARDGTRTYPTADDKTFDALVATFVRLRFVLQRRDRPNKGVDGEVLAVAPWPAPLTREEWQRAADVEIPRMREVIAEEIGELKASMFTIIPENHRIVIAARVGRTSGGTQISLAPRLAYIGPYSGVHVSPLPPSPARPLDTVGPYLDVHITPFPSPTATRLLLAKMWLTLEQELQDHGFRIDAPSNPGRGT